MNYSTTDQILALLAELIAIPSESSGYSATSADYPEQGIVTALQTFCQQHGLPCVLMKAKDTRQNLLIHLPKKNVPRVVIAAHMDTVSGVDMCDPFIPKIKNGLMYGRGACDDKGPLAMALAILASINPDDIVYDLLFAATVDEECSLAGAAALAEVISPFDLAIALEPTQLQIIHAHKGVYRFQLQTNGNATHSSMPKEGSNAIMKMVPLLLDLEAYSHELAKQTPSELGTSSLAITTVQGGHSTNIIPDQCVATVDMRLLPDMHINVVEKKIAGIVAGRAEIKTIFQGEGIWTDPQLPLVAQFQTIIRRKKGPQVSGVVSYATDCARLQKKGPCIVWGPGNIAQAHHRGEYISLDQLEMGGEIFRKFLTGGI